MKLFLPAALALTLLAASAHAATRALFATGTNDYVWLADVNPVPTTDGSGGVMTTIRLRAPGDQLKWQSVGELAEAPISLGNRGSELLVVLADGEWKILWSNDVRSGNPLPNNARVMALAGDGDDIWAIGGLDLTRRAPTTTHPTTAPAASTAPARPPHPLALFQLRRGTWSLVGDVPVEYKWEQIAAVSLAMLDRKLTLAIVGPDRAVRIFTRSGDKWSSESKEHTLNDGAQMKLLDVQSKPALWIAELNTPGALYYGHDGWKSPIKLAASPKLQQFDRRAIAYALGQLRLLATDGKGRIAEQLYNPDGTLQGEPSEAHTTPTDLEKRISSIIQFVIMGALLAWMLGSLRQRPNLAEIIAKIDQLHIAPLGRRFLGGLIDALPLIAGIVAAGVFAWRSNSGPPDGKVDLASPEIASFCAGLALYLLHVTLMEVLMGRSLGKLLTGTRVSSLDGSPPRISQLLARNALRIIDLILVGVPLLAVLQSSLRQRVGDMMGGTIVVLNAPAPLPLQPSDEAPPDQPPPPTA